MAAKQRMTHEQRAERRRMMAEAVGAGVPVGVVASRYRVTIGTVRAAYRAHGIAPPRKHVPPMLVMLAALLRGERGLDIAARLGVSKQRVDQVRAEAERAGIRVRAEAAQ